jgi:hypothetical protein
MRIRHISQLRRIGQLLRTLANQEDADGDLDSAEMLLYLSHHVHDVADVAEDQRASCVARRGNNLN